MVGFREFVTNWRNWSRLIPELPGVVPMEPGAPLGQQGQQGQPQPRPLPIAEPLGQQGQQQAVAQHVTYPPWFARLQQFLQLLLNRLYNATTPGQPSQPGGGQPQPHPLPIANPLMRLRKWT